MKGELTQLGNQFSFNNGLLEGRSQPLPEETIVRILSLAANMHTERDTAKALLILNQISAILRRPVKRNEVTVCVQQQNHCKEP